MAAISFQALQLANEHRTAYGLRYNDFSRYRKHCANRTHRVRSSIKTTHGKGREFKKLPVLATEKLKEGHLHLLLFEAERAWAHSQELITSSALPAKQSQAGTLRHSATGRFRRAVHWSTQLLSHCQSLHASSRLSTENLLHTTIYTLIMNGRFLRYRDDFEDALIQLCVARGLLTELASRATTSRDQALATLFSDEIGPEIRHCAHELGRSKAYDVDNIVAELAAKHRNEIVEGCDALLKKLEQEGQAAGNAETRKRLQTLMWEDQPVPVRNPELVDVLLRVQDAEARLAGGSGSQTHAVKGTPRRGLGASSKKSVAAYDAILLALSDAEEVARKLAEAQQPSGGGSAARTDARDIHFVHAYIVYQLLSRRIQRDLLLVSSLLNSQSSVKSARPTNANQNTKARTKHIDGRLFPAVVKVLETVLQSLGQMRTLSIVDDSPDLASAVEARLSFTKARRCLYLARCYVPAKKYAEALALVQHANIHLRETRSALSESSDPITSGNPPYYFLTKGTVDELETEQSMDGHQFKKDWFEYDGGSVDAEPSLFKKPLFFDIALNYVQLDMDRLRERAGKQPATSAGPSVADVPPSSDKRPAAKAKVEEEVRAATPEPQAAAPARGGLGGLLGGWWGRR